MDFINNLVAQFYAIPFIADIVNSHAILRIATAQYGAPLLGLIILFIVLMLVLILSRLGKKSSKPKPVREKKQKPKKALRQKKAKPARVKGPNKAIMAKLAKLPPSQLPLYPVADKRKSLEDAMALTAPAAVMAPQPVVDDESLIQGLDMPAEPIAVAPDASNATPEIQVKSFSLNEHTAANMMAGSPQDGDDQNGQNHDDFDMPAASMDDTSMDDGAMGHDHMDEEPRLSTEATLTASDDDFDLPPLDVAPLTAQDDDFDLPPLAVGSAHGDDIPADAEGNHEGQTIDPVPSLDFDPIEPLPPEEKPEDDGEAIDIPVGSFGSGNGEDLSGAAQEKLAELTDRGVT